jgi:hypothetical protein
MRWLTFDPRIHSILLHLDDSCGLISLIGNEVLKQTNNPETNPNNKVEAYEGYFPLKQCRTIECFSMATVS